MKILLVHKFHHVTGGAEVFFFETSRILESTGHSVAHFSTVDGRNLPSPFSMYFASPPVFRSGSVFQRFASIKRIVYSHEAKNKIRKLIADFKPDIVHVFAIFTHLTPSVLYACREAGVPVVFSCNDYKHICPNYKMFHHGRICDDCKNGKFHNAIRNKCCHESITYSVASCIESVVHHSFDMLRKNVHTFLFASNFMAKKTEQFWGKDTFRWKKLLNPFDSTRFPICSEYGDYLLFFGRFVDEKGVDILLRAMQLVPEARLIAVGDGPQNDKLLALAGRLGLNNVEFMGPLWGEDLDTMIKRARFVVIPSIWHENFPYVIVQSFAIGKAVIGTDRGGIPELITDSHNGFIYPAHDQKGLAEKIRILWNDPALAVSMGINAKKFADETFNDTKFYSTLMDIYKDVLG